jgi:DNA-binding beta-propeller fold protein YncE
MKTILIVCALCAMPALAQEKQVLQQVQTLPLKVNGRLGHLAVDVRHGWLFVAATEANTVEVLDLKQGTLLHSVTGFDKPQDIAVIPGSTRVYVSNADGKLRVIDTATWQQASAIDLGGAGGRLVWDSVAKRLYAGSGSGAIAMIDPVSGAKVSEIKLDGAPESFQLEKIGSRIFADIPQLSRVNVVDRKKPGTPAQIPLARAEENSSMALDEKNHRLFVVTRKPGKILVLNTVSLKWVTEFPVSDDVDDLFYDAAQKRLYAISGLAIVPPDRVGLVYVMDQMDPDHYIARQKVTTAVGAHTGVWVAETHRLYVADPAVGIRVFESK